MHYTDDLGPETNKKKTRIQTDKRLPCSLVELYCRLLS